MSTIRYTAASTSTLIHAGRCYVFPGLPLLTQAWLTPRTRCKELHKLSSPCSNHPNWTRIHRMCQVDQACAYRFQTQRDHRRLRPLQHHLCPALTPFPAAVAAAVAVAAASRASLSCCSVLWLLNLHRRQLLNCLLKRLFDPLHSVLHGSASSETHS